MTAWSSQELTKIYMYTCDLCTTVAHHSHEVKSNETVFCSTGDSTSEEGTHATLRIFLMCTIQSNAGRNGSFGAQGLKARTRARLVYVSPRKFKCAIDVKATAYISF